MFWMAWQQSSLNGSDDGCSILLLGRLPSEVDNMETPRLRDKHQSRLTAGTLEETPTLFGRPSVVGAESDSDEESED